MCVHVALRIIVGAEGGEGPEGTVVSRGLARLLQERRSWARRVPDRLDDGKRARQSKRGRISLLELDGCCGVKQLNLEASSSVDQIKFRSSSSRQGTLRTHCHAGSHGSMAPGRSWLTRKCKRRLPAAPAFGADDQDGGYKAPQPKRGDHREPDNFVVRQSFKKPAHGQAGRPGISIVDRRHDRLGPACYRVKPARGGTSFPDPLAMGGMFAAAMQLEFRTSRIAERGLHVIGIQLHRVQVENGKPRVGGIGASTAGGCRGGIGGVRGNGSKPGEKIVVVAPVTAAAAAARIVVVVLGRA